MTRLAHVFVCYGSVSWDAALRITSALRLPPSDIFVLSLFRTNREEWPADVRVYSLDARRYSEWTRALRIARWYKRILTDLRAAEFDGWIAYFPHPFEIPANDLAYRSKQVVRRELLPDGMVNYIAAPVVSGGRGAHLRYFSRVFLRCLGAASIGLRYRPLTAGSITQVERLEYDRAWANAARGFRAPTCGITPLPPKKASLAPRERRGVLFLDQELRELVDADLELEMRDRLNAQLETMRDRPIYYKAHPRGINRAAAFPFVVEDVSSDGRAEEIVESLAIDTLVGFYSTPLLFQTDDVRRMALLPAASSRGVRKHELLAEVREALASSGAQLLTIE